jgi:hypothetical protein
MTGPAEPFLFGPTWPAELFFGMKRPAKPFFFGMTRPT